MKTYSAYMFKTKDPVIDELRTLIEDAEGARVTGHHLKKIQEQGGPSKAAMRGWFFGKTRRPQSPTIEAAGRAIGFKRKWVKMNGKG
jgi:hypothetical protein